MTTLRELIALFRGRRLFTCLLVGLLVVPYTTGFISFYYAAGEFPIPPSAYLIVMSGLVSLHVFKSLPQLRPSHWLLLGLLTFRVLCAVVFGVDGTLESGAFIFELGAALVFALAVCCLLGDYDDTKAAVIVCALASITIGVWLNIYEWQNPGVFSNVPGRSAGWMENSNSSALAIVALLALLLALDLPVALSIPLIVLSGIGVYFTLSRGGCLIWALTAVAYILKVSWSNKWQLALVAGCVLAAIAAGFGVIDFQSEMGGDIAKRQAVLSGFEVSGLEDDDRFGLAKEAWAAILRNPLAGYGSGAAYGAFAPHNQLLAVWLDNGLIGLTLYLSALCALLYECARSQPRFLIGCLPLVGFIPFSHNLLEEKPILLAWVVMAGLVWHERQRRIAASSLDQMLYFSEGNKSLETAPTPSAAEAAGKRA